MEQPSQTQTTQLNLVALAAAVVEPTVQAKVEATQYLTLVALELLGRVTLVGLELSILLKTQVVAVEALAHLVRTEQTLQLLEMVELVQLG